MNIVQQRVALLATVSASVLGFATPAAAATAVSPGISHTDTTNPVDDTLVICGLADDCAFGVDASGTGSVTAIVGDPTTGQIFQQGISAGGKAALEMTNSGNAEVAAHASATANGPATAIAANHAIIQSAIGADGATADFLNTGTLSLDASAFASADGTTGELAFAYGLVTGIQLFASATGVGDAVIDADNQGSISVAAKAEALSAGPAFAQATAVLGIDAIANAAHGDAIIDIANSGDIAVVANAQATGLHAATAAAVGVGGIVAIANAADGNASADIINDGSVLIGANATAQATTNALAVAIAVTGVYDIAHAASGDANVSLDNSGTVDVIANANAAGLVAQASAVGGGALFAGGIYQSAGAVNGNSHAVLTNTGDINVAANANANGSVIAYANAFGGPGVNQIIFSLNGDAAAEMTNSGDIRLSADAEALASNSAFAVALYFNAFNNAAFATTGDASLSIDNSGSIAVNLTAHGAADNAAGAHAKGTHLVGQIGIGAGGSADVQFHNSGSISIDVGATATGAVASATATLGTAFYQSAMAFGGGSADASLANEGTIAIGANADASGELAFAAAILQTGMAQFAVATSAGDATVSIANEGTIQMGASASAIGAPETAGDDNVGEALAVVAGGVTQSAIALDGLASASLDNGGGIEISALAKAEGEGATLHLGTGSTAFTVTLGVSAVAIVDSAIAQRVSGESGSAAIVNSGTLSVAAGAIATGAKSVAAVANINHAVGQQASVTSAADLSFDNQGTLSLVATASAGATNDTADLGIAAATANVTGFTQQAIATSRTFSSGSMSGSAFLNMGHNLLGPVSISLANEGDIEIGARASADGEVSAFANAAVQVANQFAAGSDVSLSISNDGDIAASAIASAVASQSAVAQAFATGIAQFGTAQASSLTGTATAGGSGHVHSLNAGAGPVDVSLTNAGTISVIAKAQATATGAEVAASRSWALAAATAVIPVGINQGALGSSVAASLTNEGSITFGASAVAHGLQTAFAHADVQGIAQGALALGNENTVTFTAGGSGTFSGGSFFPGDASVGLDNSGSLSIIGLVEADADLMVSAQVHATGVAQVARGLNASAIVDNGGTITVGGSVVGVADGSMSNFAAVSGINQIAMGPDSAVASVVNSGSIKVTAHAAGTAGSGRATNIAVAGGIAQDSYSLDEEAVSSVTNSGSISVMAGAESNGGMEAFAGAYAEGIGQDPLFGTLNATLDNSGDIAVLAAASAVATGGAYASANATGFHADAANIVASIVNSGDFTVAASAVASGTSGSAYAFAGGISMTAAFHGTSGPTGLISGTIENSGSLMVSAKVESAASGTVGATATGIFLNSAENDATVVNSGSIVVQAVTGHGAPATAYGVRLVNWYGPEVDGDDVFIFTNDGGDIVVRQSVDGGTTWQRGTAIDLTEAPTNSVVNLLGNGSIFGNIALQDGDVINVEDGTTVFDGIINPASMPEGGITAADLDSGLSGPGTLNIGNGGNLVLVSGNANAAMDDGPSYAFVDTLNIASDGTVTFVLPDPTGTAAPGTYPQIFADEAHLDGTLVANIQPANGLFETTRYENVIDANARSGQFDSCALAGPFTNSLLLDLECEYDNKANVDLALTRIAFGDVAGLNANGVAVGEGLECIVDVSLTGGAADMLADLFLFTDAANYNIALNMLSGSVYANYLNSFPSLGVHYNDLTDHATNCEIPALGGSVLECRASSPIHVWGQVDYQTRKADGDIEAGDTRSKRFTGLLGVDATVGNAAILGVDAGYVSNHLRDHRFGDSAKGDGWQVGAYGVYDPGSFFVKGVTTYSSLNGDSSRTVDFAGLAPGATFAGRLGGDPDVKMWTFGLHGGARFDMSANSVITPYLNYDYVHAKLRGFTEDGLEGANLTVEGSSANHSFLTGGVKWATQMGGVVPEVNLGYRHRFGDKRSDFRAFFNGDTDCDFDIVSAAQKRGTFLAGVSVGGKLGPVDLRIGYEGEFNGDVTSHSGNFKLVLPLGGHAAPPPPAPVAAPPPPPPPVVEQPAPPPPPPPPPAPVEGGERGR